MTNPTALIERVKSLLLQPRTTWVAIAAEPATTASLYQRYLMILAAIPAVCGFIGLSLIGFGGFGVTVRIPLLAGLVNMVVGYLLTLGGVYVLALLIDALAPTFGGQRDRLAALKLAVYASTAALLGGVFSLLPALAVLGLVAALYSVYLLYTGLPVLMRNPAEKSVAYTVVLVVAAIVAGLVVGALTSLVMPGAMMGAGATAGTGAVSISTPDGKVTIDTTQMEAAAKKMEDAARQMEQAAKSNDNTGMAQAGAQAAAAAMAGLGGNAKAGAIASQSLKTALPEQLGGLPRTSFEVQDGQAIGLATSSAQAQYAAGDKSISLDITDLGAMAQLVNAAGAMVQGEKETTTSTEKTWQAAGRTLHLKAEKDGSRAEFSTTLKNGLVVAVQGTRMGAADVQAAAAQLDLGALEALQRSPRP